MARTRGNGRKLSNVPKHSTPTEKEKAITVPDTDPDCEKFEGSISNGRKGYITYYVAGEVVSSTMSPMVKLLPYLFDMHSLAQLKQHKLLMVCLKVVIDDQYRCMLDEDVILHQEGKCHYVIKDVYPVLHGLTLVAWHCMPDTVFATRWGCPGVTMRDKLQAAFTASLPGRLLVMQLVTEAPKRPSVPNYPPLVFAPGEPLTAHMPSIGILNNYERPSVKRMRVSAALSCKQAAPPMAQQTPQQQPHQAAGMRCKDYVPFALGVGASSATEAVQHAAYLCSRRTSCVNPRALLLQALWGFARALWFTPLQPCPSPATWFTAVAKLTEQQAKDHLVLLGQSLPDLQKTAALNVEHLQQCLREYITASALLHSWPRSRDGGPDSSNSNVQMQHARVIASVHAHELNKLVCMQDLNTCMSELHHLAVHLRPILLSLGMDLQAWLLKLARIPLFQVEMVLACGLDMVAAEAWCAENITQCTAVRQMLTV